MLGLSDVVWALVFLYIGQYAYRFVRNYVRARSTGLPVIVIPVDHTSMFWMVASVALRPWMAKHLPAKLWAHLKYSIYGWEHYEKLRPFHSTQASRQGFADEKTFMLSTFGRLELWTSNPSMAQQILSRPNDFQQLDLGKLFVGIFGTSVLTADGDEWARHRRVVASAVTERISPGVWVESIKQTTGMIEELCGGSDDSQGESIRIFDMIKTVAIHVLSKAGMGVEKDWTEKEGSSLRKVGSDKSDKNLEVTYLEAVKLLNNFLAGPVAMPTQALLNWPSFMPDYINLRRLGLAKVQFPIRTKEMLAEERKSIETSGMNDRDNSSNFMRTLIAASYESGEGQGRDKGATPSKKNPALSDDELVSNLYIFTAAGYDTTANTVSYAIMLLMRYPKWQDWIFEVVDPLLADHGISPGDMDGLSSNYQAIFPRCSRVLALMYETLRHFTPVVHLAKMAHKVQTITGKKGELITIPAGSTVYINSIALHLDPSVWRDLNPASIDAIEDWEDDMPGRFGAAEADIKSGGGKLGDEWRFRPTRWIKNNASAAGGTTATEALFQPPRGTFIPWSAGPRVCPGQKMAQVEFTAIIVTILSKYRLEAVAFEGENADELKERLDAIMQNSFSKLTLEMDSVYNKDEEVDGKAYTNTSKDQSWKKGLKVRLVKRKTSSSATSKMSNTAF